MLVDDLLGRRLPTSVRNNGRGRQRMGASQAISEYLRELKRPAKIVEITRAVYKTDDRTIRRRTSTLLQKMRREGFKVRMHGHGIWVFDISARHEQKPRRRVTDLRARCLREIRRCRPAVVTLQQLANASHGSDDASNRRACSRTLEHAVRRGEPIERVGRGLWRWVD